MSQISPIKRQINNYLEYLLIDRQRSNKTIENYRHYLNTFIKWGNIKTINGLNEDLGKK